MKIMMTPYTVMIVVDFGGLAVVGAEDAPGVLEEASLLGDGRGEEQGVERRAVEAFPGVGAGGDREQRCPARLAGFSRRLSPIASRTSPVPGRRAVLAAGPSRPGPAR